MSLSLRTRLGLCYGGLTGLVVLLVSLMSYALHARTEYGDVDETLVGATSHVAAEYLAASTPAEREAVVRAAVATDVGMRVTDAGGQTIVEGAYAEQAPGFSPAAILNGPAPAPYDLIAYAAPRVGSVKPGDGGFGLLISGQNRWRIYVVRLDSSDSYLSGVASLHLVDASVAAFRDFVPLLALLGAAVALIAGWLLASRALRPVASLTDTARSVARSGDLKRRVPSPVHRDELGRLAATFNEMLDSIEAGAKAQQRFVADASHELRAPLTAIQANLELLERLPEMTAADRKEATSEASRESRRLARLVSDLLILARADAGAPLRRERVALDSLALEAMSEIRHLAAGQRLDIERVEPVVVPGDEDRLKQLLIILLDNAIKYTPAHGTVTLSVRHSASAAEVVVRDTGVGITAMDLPHVFERFYRADPARGRDPGGTGLGLSIAQWIAERHGGRISISSEPANGTTVTVRLPTAGATDLPVQPRPTGRPSAVPAQATS